MWKNRQWGETVLLYFLWEILCIAEVPLPLSSPTAHSPFSSCVQREEAHPPALGELKTSQLCPENKGPVFTAFSPCLTDLIWVLALNMSEWEGRLVMPFIIIIILLVCFFARKRVGGKMFLLGSLRREINFSTALQAWCVPHWKSLPRWAPAGISIPILRTKSRITEKSEVKSLFFPQCDALADSSGQGMLIL